MKPLQRLVEAGNRMHEFEHKYGSHPDYPDLPVIVDLVEYYPDREKYAQAINDFWSAARDFFKDVKLREGA